MKKPSYGNFKKMKLAQIPDSATAGTNDLLEWSGQPSDISTNSEGTWKRVKYKKTGQTGWVNVLTDKTSPKSLQPSLEVVDAATAATAPEPTPPTTDTAASSDPPKKLKVKNTGGDKVPGLPLMKNPYYKPWDGNFTGKRAQDGQTVFWIDKPENKTPPPATTWLYVSFDDTSGWVRTKTDADAKIPNASSLQEVEVL
jgi:hypothetical protein